MMELEPIHEIDADVWDQEIAGYASKLLFHQSAWLKFLEETQQGQVVRFRILNGSTVAGYFAGLLIMKGFFKILGSPLIGWKTDHMGPIVNQGFDLASFLPALDDACRAMGVHLVQLAHPWLNPDLMNRHGYDMDGWMVFVVPLTRDEESMWRAVTGKCRNRVRKGLQNCLRVEAWDGPGFVEEYYSQFIEVFSRQGTHPYYSMEMVQSLVRNLWPDNLLCLRVKLEEKTIATGIFVHDDHHVYSFGSASRTEYLKYYPNELLFWTVMKHFGAEGKLDFCIGGNYRVPASGGKFKEKFNGRQQAVFRHTKCYSLLARVGRRFHTYRYQAQEMLSRKWRGK